MCVILPFGCNDARAVTMARPQHLSAAGHFERVVVSANPPKKYHHRHCTKNTTPGPRSQRSRERERSRARPDDAADESGGGTPGVPGGESGGGPPGESGSTTVPTVTVVREFRLMSSHARQHGHRMRNACLLHVSGCSMKTKSGGIKYRAE